MITRVIKRNGKIVDFSSEKIKNAIKGAFSDIKVDYDENIYKSVIWYLRELNKEVLTVEQIQDVIEKSLMKKFPDVAKAYIVYRYTRALVRKSNTTDESILSLIRNSNKDVMEENSNKNAHIASTQRDLIAGEVSKDLTKRMLLPEKISKAHEEGILHFHDADYFIQPIFNCCLINASSVWFTSPD